MAKEKLNGSVDALASAMKAVFTEAVEGAVEPLTTEVKALRTETRDMRKTMATKEDVERLENDVRRLDTDMQNGFAELRPPEPEDATRSNPGT